MDTFLDFLNTAESIELTKLSGVDIALAERIMAARPFQTEQDVAKVSGLNEKKVANMKAAFEKSDQIIYMSNQTPVRIPEKTIPNNATITIKTDAAQEKNESVKKKGAGHWIGRALTYIFVTILILIIMGALGAGVYYGVPYFYEKIIMPIELNTTKISEIATQQASDLSDMQTLVNELQTQIDTLQSRNDEMGLTIAAHTESIAQLEILQADLELALSQQSQGLSDTLTSRLEYDLMITRAIELLSRANLYLSQSNFGLAREDIHTAYSLLTTSQPSSISNEKRLFLLTVTQRLEFALNNLPAYPVVAANDVQIAWQYLVDGGIPVDAIPVPVFTPTYTPTPYFTITPEMMTPTPYLTPTAN
jgi:ribosomal protein S13